MTDYFAGGNNGTEANNGIVPPAPAADGDVGMGEVS
jgi:hypothetical protein